MLKYKLYFRKSGFKKDKKNSLIFLEAVKKKSPKVFLEIGVLQGVTARNVCELLHSIHQKNFRYIGIDLFGDISKEESDLAFTTIHNKIANPFKKIFFNYILKKNLNSYSAVSGLLRKFKNNVELYKGYSHVFLNKIDLKDVNFVFLDGGHSYQVVKNDLNILLSKLCKSATIICDDYNQKHYGVKKAVDEIDIKKFKISILNGRFAEIIT